ncbi:ribosome small subunit-dependent GTPase A [Sulfitobacter sp. F26204]|uniref:ribosome small subunit-dependent GTPase A n=1 Tax=Sulfitobacter sp. F26204 TaxID=2996014 RepID=UPI00225DD022|nr:ribosome small subunit-dependent GTPase A [Sulfitobacter sp. F26204]MCX7560467.1 ribosome small subunit-dependent GTPase A [Sulfitobacter sp. F26204]
MVMDTAQSLVALGWSAFFEEQRDPAEADLTPVRVSTVHRSRMTGESATGPVRLNLPGNVKTTDFAVGDWVLLAPQSDMVVRRLERHALLQRKTEGARLPQLIAANVDTLLVVTSCNEDFNSARLERYLALANEAGTDPVIVLTKADQIVDVTPFRTQAEALQRSLTVVSLNAKEPEAAEALAPWCGPGQTVALVGSSGVGKSTLLNTLTGKSGKSAQRTGGIREDDAKGRHTTTSRSLHSTQGGGCVIDTPGIRTLHVSDVATGLEMLFAEITELAPDCRFRDCTHAHEPGCAVQAAVAAGDLDPARLDRWRKLSEENRDNTPISTGPRGNKTPQSRRKKR